MVCCRLIDTKLRGDQRSLFMLVLPWVNVFHLFSLCLRAAKGQQQAVWFSEPALQAPGSSGLTFQDAQSAMFVSVQEGDSYGQAQRKGALVYHVQGFC